MSANCLGNDLPGQAARVWQGGNWLEAEDYLFALSADLEVARQRYLAYLDAISLQSGPPGNDFPEILAQHMNSAGRLPAPESCLADEITSRVSALGEGGQYVRLTFTEPLQWAEPYHLFVSVGDIELALPWSTAAVRQELIAVESGEVVKTDTMSRFAGTALMTWDSNSGQWYVADDDGGYYCNYLPKFVD
ncbi:MAG: hypothetical protein IT318_16585 [Anaerolineales bacterium]|nr:hypothetical protein [Anaerolineales bacterium]